MAGFVNSILSRRQVEGLIADGKTIIIVDDLVLKLDSWLKYHPGGDKAIFHMLGRDATAEVNALHSKEARSMMSKFKIGRIEGPWVNFKPKVQGGTFRPYYENCENEEIDNEDGLNVENDSPISSGDEQDIVFDPRLRRRGAKSSSSSSSVSSLSDVDEAGKIAPNAALKKALDIDLAKYPSLDAKTQQKILRKYQELDARIHMMGLYDCNYTAYAWECSRYISLAALSVYFLTTGWYKTSALFLGLLWHQLVFTAHDAGHMGITHSYVVDTLIGIFIADFCGGLSIGWWKRNHNVHHIVTNEPEHDPDIQHLPFFAIDSRFFSNLYSTYYERILPYDAFSQFVIRYQNYLYYPMLCFGRFNLYRLSIQYLVMSQGPKKGRGAWHRWVEIVSLIGFWSWFGYGFIYKGLPTNWDRFVYVMISHMVTMPVHVQITLSHFAMSTSDMGIHESFPQKMMRTTMDVVCPTWLDFLHGGLQFQAIHHLYPRIPRHNLRTVQPLVMEYCREVGLPYAMYGFYDGNKEVIGRLEEISRQAAIFRECQEHCIENKEFGHF